MKRNSQRKWFLLMALVLLLTLPAGCGTSGTDTSAEGSSAAESGDETGEAGFPTMNIQLSHVNPTTDDDQYHKFAVEFTQRVTEATGGAVTFDICGNSELGGEADVLTGFDLGTHELGIISNGTFAAVYGPSNIVEMPFFFKDNQTAYDFLDSELMQEVTDSLYEDMGYKVLGWAEGGFRNILSQKPIREPADLEGMKIRVPEFDTFMATFKELGANPTPMAFSEVFTAAQQGVIDGLELPIASTYTGSYYEVFDYYDLSGHFYNAISMACSRTFWESLTPELQEIFVSAAVEAGQVQRAWLEDASEAMLEDMEAKGCQIIRDVDVAAFQEAVTPVYDLYREKIGDELMDRALEAVQ